MDRGNPAGGAPREATAIPSGGDGAHSRGTDPAEQSMAGQSRLAFSAWQLAGALLVAGASDVVGGLVDATIAGVPATIPLDILTALALWAILGRPVLLLVALVAEALPGVGVLPVWSAVVIAIAMTGGIPGRMPR
jgi:hypothetical protein